MQITLSPIFVDATNALPPDGLGGPQEGTNLADKVIALVATMSSLSRPKLSNCDACLIYIRPQQFLRECLSQIMLSSDALNI